MSVKTGSVVTSADLKTLMNNLITLYNNRPLKLDEMSSSLAARSFYINTVNGEEIDIEQGSPITKTTLGNLIRKVLVIGEVPHLADAFDTTPYNTQNGLPVFYNGTATDLITWTNNYKDKKGRDSGSGCRGACVGICEGGCSGTGYGQTGSGGYENPGSSGTDTSPGRACTGCSTRCTSGCGKSCTIVCTMNENTGSQTIVCRGCGRSCSAGCADSCSSACNNCTGNCTGGCSWRCTGNCKGTCSGCSGSCGSGCSGACGSACTGCAGTCQGHCEKTCSNGCAVNCTGFCFGSAK